MVLIPGWLCQTFSCAELMLDFRVVVILFEWLFMKWPTFLSFQLLQYNLMFKKFPFWLCLQIIPLMIFDEVLKLNNFNPGWIFLAFVTMNFGDVSSRDKDNFGIDFVQTFACQIELLHSASPWFKLGTTDDLYTTTMFHPRRLLSFAWAIWR